MFKVHTVPYSALTSNVCTCYLSSELYAMICKTQLRYVRAVGGWENRFWMKLAVAYWLERAQIHDMSLVRVALCIKLGLTYDWLLFALEKVTVLIG